MTESGDRPPHVVTHLARERSAARAARDFARADVLRAEIEAAGWRVVDRSGGGTILERAAPADVVDDRGARYGRSEAVPSRLDGPPTAAFSVVAIADDRPAELARLLAALRSTAPSGTHVVIVANAPSADQDARLAHGSPDLAPVMGASPEVVRTSARLGHATALNAGLRRASGEVVVLADPSVEPTADALTPLAGALADPSVAVAGAAGLASADLRHFRPSGTDEVAAVEAGWLAFRRFDLQRLGPLDEHFVVPAHLDEWWSLTLRAGIDGDPIRRAVRLDLPITRHATGGTAGGRTAGAELARLEKRNAYRLLDAFRGRPELARDG